MITEININMLTSNFVVGEIKGEQSVVVLPTSEISNIVQIFNSKGVPLHKMYDSLASPIVIDDVSNDISMIPLESVTLLIDNIYKANNVYMSKEFIERDGIYELCEKEE